MSVMVIVETEAKANLLGLYEYLLERVDYVEDLDVADRALQAIKAAMTSLASAPFLFRKAAGSRSALRRELVIPLDASHEPSGYEVKYEIASPMLVVLLAVRHQHEADFD